MQTVYLLQGCKTSSNALYKLRRAPDMTTLIVVVPENQKKILLLDKRVKTFPFIINTPPNRQGLIPIRAVVMPFDKAVKVSQGIFSNKSTNKITNKSTNKITNKSTNSGRVINIPSSVDTNRPRIKYNPLPKINRQPIIRPRINEPTTRKMNFSIKKVENCDGSTLILKKI
jgi:hypothetical protein